MTSPAVLATTRVAGAPGVAVLTLQSAPVNLLTMEMWAGLLIALDELEADASVQALVIESGLPRAVFSAGNDLKELHPKLTTVARHAEFWRLQNTFWARLFRSRLFTIAAIRGACPAAGCIIALTCDSRIMLDTQDTYMGLNEPQIGLAVPPLVRNLLARIVGEARADGLTFLGKYSNPKDAYRFGLVDELVASPTESAGTAEAIATLRAVAVKRAAAAANIPAPGRVDTKLASRSAFAALLEDHERLKRESEGWAKSAQDPAKAAAFEASFAKFAGGAKKNTKL